MQQPPTPVYMTKSVSEKMNKEILPKWGAFQKLRAPVWRINTKLVMTGVKALVALAFLQPARNFFLRTAKTRIGGRLFIALPVLLMLFGVKMLYDNRAKATKVEAEVQRQRKEINELVLPVQKELLEKLKAIRELIRVGSGDELLTKAKKRERFLKAQNTVKKHVIPMFGYQKFQAEVREIFDLNGKAQS